MTQFPSSPPPPPPPPPPYVPQQQIGDSAGMRMLLPVGRSAWAIGAGYMGLISVLVLPAPFAVWFSIMAIREIRRSKNTPKPVHGMGRAIFGLIMGVPFTLLGLFLLGMGIVNAMSH